MGRDEDRIRGRLEISMIEGAWGEKDKEGSEETMILVLRISGSDDPKNHLSLKRIDV